MKRFISLIITLCLIFSMFGAVNADQTVYLSYYTVDTPIITADSVCGISFGVVGISEGIITVSADTQSAFQLTRGNIIQDVNVHNGKTEPIYFYYDGSDKNLSLTVVNPQTGGVGTQTILISEAQPSMGNQSGSDIQPKLQVSGNPQTLMAGQTAEILLTVMNHSPYPAMNAVCEFSTDNSNIYPSMLSSTVNVGNVMPGSSVPLTIPLTVSSDAQAGYHTVSLNFRYDNGYGEFVEQSETIGVTVDNSVSAELSAVIDISSASLDKTVIGADNTATLTVELHNSGELDANNVEVSLDGYSVNGFSLNDSIGTRRFVTIGSGRKMSASFPLKVSSELKSGSHPITVKVSYYNGNETVEKSEEVYVNITRNPSAGVCITEAKLNTNKPGSSNEVKLHVTVANRDTVAVTNVRTSIDGLSTNGFTLSGTFGSKDIATLAPGTSGNLTFPLYVAENLATGNYPLTLVTKYLDSSGAEQTVETEIYLYIDRPDVLQNGQDLPDSTPRVIISKYNVNTELIEAGSEFLFDFTLKNTSTTTAIKNLKIVLSSDEGVFLPVEGSNSFYQPYIKASGEAKFSIKLMPKRDAETKTYPLNIRIDYENEKNTSYNVTETLSFGVNQQQRLEVNNLSFYPNGMSSSPISLQYINKGKAILYNLSIRVEGPFTSEYGVQYMGNFGIGSSEFFEDYITPTETGELTGKVIIEFEDVNGKKTEVVEEFTALIEDMSQLEEPIGDGMITDGEMYPEFEAESNGSGISTWLIVGIVGGVVLIIAGVVTFILIRRKRRNAVEMVADE